MKRLLFLFAVVLLQACDYSIYYEFKVENATDLTLDMVLPGNSPDDRKVVYIRPRTTVQVHVDSPFMGGKFDIPEDVIPGDSLLPSCAVYGFSAAGEPIPERFRQRMYWDFEASERLGVYTLTVTPGMLDDSGAENPDL